MSQFSVVSDFEIVVEIDDTVLEEKIYNESRKEMNFFVRLVECSFEHITKDIDGWWVDSGATRHIAKTKDDLTEFVEVKKGEQNFIWEIGLI